MKMSKLKKLLLTGIALLFLIPGSGGTSPVDHNLMVSRMLSLIQERDAVLLTDPSGAVLASRHADKLLVPASTLKILTSLVAIHYLGENYRFVTECYQDKERNLKIKGFGDPLFLSEVMPDFSRRIQRHLNAYNNMILDDSAFQQPLRIPGVSETSEPYDAPIGAFCANFNTIHFRKTADGKYASAEPQTPMVPFVVSKIRASGMNSGRIVFSHAQGENVLYAGHLVAEFLSQQGIKVSGEVRIGRVDADDLLFLEYASPYPLKDVIAKLMAYSNNYIANQLFIAAGIRAYGLPGTIDKGIRATQDFLRREMKLETVQIAEGSGISRENRISAVQMDRLLTKFHPYRELMRRQGNELYKTGTLDGVRTRAGYIEDRNGGIYRFVVMINTPGKTAEPVMEIIRQIAVS